MAAFNANRPAPPIREMLDPWTSSSVGATSSFQAPTPAIHDGLASPPPSAAGFTSAFRGFESSTNPMLAARSKKSSSSTNGANGFETGAYRSGLIENGEEEENGFASLATLRTSRFLDAATASIVVPVSQFRSRNNPGSSQRPFSYLSDSADVNADGGAEDPASGSPLDEVTVRLREELEGFIIKHHVYLVISKLRHSQVYRRYSDWVWLSECLVKRYPFRCLPILPPKRLSIPVAGRHFSTDDQFIERRRRGLERYLKVLSSHPILREDKLVEVFFTESRPLAEWRQSAPPLYLDEEGMTKVLSDVERMSIPEDLDTKIAQQKKVIPELLERWTAIMNLFERILKRNEAAAADFSRLNFGLLSVVESSNRRWTPESDSRKATEDCISKIASSSQVYADLLGARASASSVSTLESLKAQRDLIHSFRDLFLRLDRLMVDPVDSLQRRIETTSKRLTTLSSPSNPPTTTTTITTTSPQQQEEYQKLVSQIQTDTQQVEKYTNRRFHTRKTMWQEMIWFHWRYRDIEPVWYQWVQDEVVYHNQVARKWDELDMTLKMSM